MRVVSWEAVPALTAEQMREVDRLMVDALHIELAQMVENAGRNLADLAIQLFAPSSVTVLAGPGGNGGGGLVAARHLHNRGAQVKIVLSHPAPELAPATAHQLDILRRMEVGIQDEPSPASLVIDALIGYGLTGDPRGRAEALIEWANLQGGPVLALDTPSGLDVTTGRAGSPSIQATATMTLALPKVGLLKAHRQVGRLYLADISVPTLVYQRLGLTVPFLFQDGAIVEVSLPGNGGRAGALDHRAEV
jgi:NAD(P)H-hydrate epimerase